MCTLDSGPYGPCRDKTNRVVFNHQELCIKYVCVPVKIRRVSLDSNPQPLPHTAAVTLSLTLTVGASGPSRIPQLLGFCSALTKPSSPRRSPWA